MDRAMRFAAVSRRPIAGGVSRKPKLSILAGCAGENALKDEGY